MFRSPKTNSFVQHSLSISVFTARKHCTVGYRWVVTPLNVYTHVPSQPKTVNNLKIQLKSNIREIDAKKLQRIHF